MYVRIKQDHSIKKDQAEASVRRQDQALQRRKSNFGSTEKCFLRQLQGFWLKRSMVFTT